jgi:hypothetical protein
MRRPKKQMSSWLEARFKVAFIVASVTFSGTFLGWVTS